MRRLWPYLERGVTAMTKNTSTALSAPHEVEIIPSSNIDGLSDALERINIGDSVLAKFLEKARDINIESTHDYQTIGAVLTETRTIKAQGNAQLTPFEIIVNRVKSFLSSKKKEH